MKWPIIQRLLSVLPGVCRSGDHSSKISFAPGAPAWLSSSSTYPNRVIAPSDYASAITRIPAEHVNQRPTDWVISEGELHRLPEAQLDTYVAAVLNSLHRRGGYVIFQIETTQDPEAEFGSIIKATPEWWCARINSVADLMGLDLHYLWQSMVGFQVLKLRRLWPEERSILETWRIENVFMAEVRPVKAKDQIEPSEHKSIWEKIILKLR